MLRADVVVLETDRFLARHRQNLTHSVGEVVIHVFLVAGSSHAYRRLQLCYTVLRKLRPFATGTGHFLLTAATYVRSEHRPLLRGHAERRTPYASRFPPHSVRAPPPAPDAQSA